MVARPSLAGLVLAGGRSTRMLRDKAAIEVAGENQLARAVRLVRGIAANTFVSVRDEQRGDATRSRWPQIIDRLEGVGPAAGILSALEARPDDAWLVVAVDLPLLDGATLAHLVAERDPGAIATAYRSSSDDLPEPLCAIWEPASRAPLAAFIEGGRSCPRKFLLLHGAKLIELEAPGALANVNTPAELAALLGDPRSGAA